MALRILQIVTTMNRGGLETMLMNYYRHIDRSKVQFDFLVHRPDEGDYEQEILSLGGKIYRVPALNPFSSAYYKALDAFFSEHTYEIVHCHLDCMSAVPLAVAKKHGVKHRFAHVHSKSQDKDYKYPIKLLFKRLIPFYATELFACGNDAGKWMYSGKSFFVLNNAIDAKQYSFNQAMRMNIRQELSLSNHFTVCHVGRFNYPKNHRFIIDVFYELLNLEPNAQLLLIGAGDGMASIISKVETLGISSKVQFLGLRSDIPDLLMASDAFLFPSLYEGVSLATMEAQASGLPCFFSDRIPQECRVTDEVTFIPLEKSPAYWAKEVLNSKNHYRAYNYDRIKNAGYDISDKASFLENIYLNKGGKTSE